MTKKHCPVCHTEHDLISELCDNYNDLFLEQVAWGMAALEESREEAERHGRKWFAKNGLRVTV